MYCTGDVVQPDLVTSPLKYFQASIRRCTVGVPPFAVMLPMSVVSDARADEVLSWTGKRNLFWLVSCHVVIALVLP